MAVTIQVVLVAKAGVVPAAPGRLCHGLAEAGHAGVALGLRAVAEPVQHDDVEVGLTEFVTKLFAYQVTGMALIRLDEGDALGRLDDRG